MIREKMQTALRSRLVLGVFLFFLGAAVMAIGLGLFGGIGWSSVMPVLNTQFVSAFLSSLAGAGFGVWGAQYVAQRAAMKAELLDGLRQSNAIIVLAGVVANEALSHKSQYVKPLTDRYFSDQKVAIEHNKEILSGVARPKTFHAELVKVTPPTLPLDALKNLVFNAKLIPGKSLALVAMVEQVAGELAHVIGLRTELIDVFHQSNLDAAEYCQAYFGLEREDGNVNSMYADAMSGMMHYTNDLAFFAAELAAAMERNARAVAEKLKDLGVKSPRVSSADFTDARDSGLMPGHDAYESWLSGFRDAEG